MKKLIILGTMLFFASQKIFATQPYSELHLNAQNKNQLAVTIDGSAVQTNQNQPIVVNLASGNHAIQIYEWTQDTWGQQTQQLVYNGQINIPYYSAVYATLYSNGNLQTDNVYALGNNNYNNNGPVYVNRPVQNIIPIPIPMPVPIRSNYYYPVQSYYNNYNRGWGYGYGHHGYGHHGGCGRR